MLAADVLYCDEASNRALLEVLCQLASPHTEILVAYTMRDAEHGPPGSAAPHPSFGLPRVASRSPASRRCGTSR